MTNYTHSLSANFPKALDGVIESVGINRLETGNEKTSNRVRLHIPPPIKIEGQSFCKKVIAKDAAVRSYAEIVS